MYVTHSRCTRVAEPAMEWMKGARSYHAGPLLCCAVGSVVTGFDQQSANHDSRGTVAALSRKPQTRLSEVLVSETCVNAHSSA